MSTASTRLPEGRYGRTSDERGDRMLKIIGAVLSVVMLVLVGWFGYHYVVKNEISGDVIGFTTAPDTVRIRLEFLINHATTADCSVRSTALAGAEAGRVDFRFDEDATRVEKIVTLRTTARGATGELIGCHAD